MVNTDKHICRAIALLLPQYGIREVIVSPGSRNVPVIMALNRSGNLCITHIVDERCAAFIALGKAMMTGRPVAIVCTSGSAVLNYAPAIAEAKYRQIPLVIISADRPKEWIDQDDSQTIRQAGVLDNIVVASTDVDDEESHEWLNEREINRVLGQSSAPYKGPVHINVHLSAPLSRECDSEYDTEEDVMKIEIVEPEQHLSVSQARDLAERILDKKVLIVGAFNPPDSRLSDALRRLAQLPNIAVIAEGLANIHAAGILSRPSAVLAYADESTKHELTPDIVISFGGSLVSNELKTFLRGLTNCKHWYVGKIPGLIDCFQSLTLKAEFAPAGFFHRLAGASTHLNKKYQHQVEMDSRMCSFSSLWRKVHEAAIVKVEKFTSQAPWCDIKAVSLIVNGLPSSCNLQLGNGMCVRYGLMQDTSRLHRVDSNRGVSGIDGCISTAIGAASSYNKLTYAVIGDMSAVYDMGAMAYAALSPNLRLIIINNGGGGIFHCVATTRNLAERDIVTGSPKPPVKELSETYHLKYFRASNENELIDAMDEMLRVENSACVLEVFTDGRLSADVMLDFMNNIKNNK